MNGDARDWLTDRAARLGFDAVGICEARPSPRAAAAFERWLSTGMHAEMSYMARPDRVRRTLDPDFERRLPGASRLVVVARSYAATCDEAVLRDPSRGRLAMYAWRPDYHDEMRRRLRLLAEELEQRRGRPVGPVPRLFVDTGPLLERDAAERAGLGFVGRSGQLIRPGPGSRLFLGAVLVDDEWPLDGPTAGQGCGHCRRCMDACPTSAFAAPYVLDARLCISYLTIENRGPIPERARPLLGNRVFGCDVCADVCPYNAAVARSAPAPATAADTAAPELAEIATLDDSAFARRFGGTPVARARRAGLARNACIALGNWASTEATGPLVAALGDESALVRAHAAWALGRVDASGARDALVRASRRETDAGAQSEMRRALTGTAPEGAPPSSA